MSVSSVASAWPQGTRGMVRPQTSGARPNPANSRVPQSPAVRPVRRCFALHHCRLPLSIPCCSQLYNAVDIQSHQSLVVLCCPVLSCTVLYCTVLLCPPSVRLTNVQSTSHASTKSRQNRPSADPPLSKMTSKFQQAAVSIVNGGCLCKHPTLGRGGTCPNCQKKLPALADKFSTLRLRSAAGAQGAGYEGSSTPSLARVVHRAMAHRGAGSNDAPKLGFVARPSTVDVGRTRHQKTVTVASPEVEIKSPVHQDCECCDQLKQELTSEKEQMAELRTSIDRLNSQVSYHIFSNTQLQRDLDKARGKGRPEESKEDPKLRAQLQAITSERDALAKQCAEATANDEILRRAQSSVRALKIELKEAQDALQDSGSESNKLASQWKGACEVEKTRNARLQKELEAANALASKLKLEIETGGKQGEDMKKRLAKLTDSLKIATKEGKAAESKLKEAEGRVKLLTDELAALRQQQQLSGEAGAGVKDALRGEVSTLTQRVGVLEKAESKLKTRTEQLEHELKSTAHGYKLTCSELQAVQAAKELLVKERDQLLAEAEQHRKEGGEVDQRREQSDAASAQQIAELEQQVQKLTLQNADLTSQVSALSQLQSELHQVQDELERLKLAHIALTEENEQRRQQEKALSTLVRGARQELSRAEQGWAVSKKEVVVLREKLELCKAKHSESQLVAARAQQQLEALHKTSAAEQAGLRAQIKQLQAELSALESSKNKLLDKANKALEKLKSQVLQMTCQGLLRLCVVAPRVTIAFEMKNINVAALLPSMEIHDMLERELLPKYTKVFLQPGENLGPEGEEMEKWLQGLLKDMETKIEQKLVSVLNENVPKGSVVASTPRRK